MRKKTIGPYLLLSLFIAATMMSCSEEEDLEDYDLPGSIEDRPNERPIDSKHDTLRVNQELMERPDYPVEYEEETTNPSYHWIKATEY